VKLPSVPRTLKSQGALVSWSHIKELLHWRRKTAIRRPLGRISLDPYGVEQAIELPLKISGVVAAEPGYARLVSSKPSLRMVFGTKVAAPTPRARRARPSVRARRCYISRVKDLGRRVLGIAAVAFGAIGLTWHDFNDWQQLQRLWNAPWGAFLVYLAAVAQIAGGATLQWRRTARSGAVALGVVYLFYALRWIPRIVLEPGVFDRWGNFFEQLSLVCGAVIVYASAARAAPWAARASRMAVILFGVCVMSFTLGQLVYLGAVADFVPAWLPPGQMFWAIITTLALALAAVAILSGRQALLATRLLTAMFVVFGLLVWLPRVISDPHDHTNWGGNAQNLAITAAAWIVADFLRRRETPHEASAPLLAA
jgi:hypothetical protein